VDYSTALSESRLQVSAWGGGRMVTVIIEVLSLVKSEKSSISLADIPVMIRTTYLPNRVHGVTTK
jgi:hypothetical protein